MSNNIVITAAPISSDKRYEDLCGDSVAFDITKRMNDFVDKMADRTINEAMKAIHAREFMDWHTNHVRKSWMTWRDEGHKILEDIRQSRIAIEFESRHLLAACADVRKFFISEQHEQEIAKLKEFVHLAERLKALKDDGTLDKLADTILKLS